MKQIGSPPRPAGLRRRLFRLPIVLYRIGLGGLLGSRFVLICHRGRRTGTEHQAVVEVVRRIDRNVTVAAGFGPGSDWYRNLIANPETTITVGRRTYAVVARPVANDDRGDAMTAYARLHPRAARRLARFMGFAVDGSDADYRAMGEAIPMLRFEPRPTG